MKYALYGLLAIVAYKLLNLKGSLYMTKVQPQSSPVLTSDVRPQPILPIPELIVTQEQVNQDKSPIPPIDDSNQPIDYAVGGGGVSIISHDLYDGGYYLYQRNQLEQQML